MLQDKVERLLLHALVRFPTTMAGVPAKGISNRGGIGVTSSRMNAYGTRERFLLTDHHSQR